MQTLISILNGATVLAGEIDLMELFESRMAMSVIIGETQPQQPAHTLAWPFLSPQRKSPYMLRTLRFTMDVLGITTRSQLAKHLQESKQPKSVSLYSPEKLLEVKFEVQKSRSYFSLIFRVHVFHFYHTSNFSFTVP